MLFRLGVFVFLLAFLPSARSFIPTDLHKTGAIIFGTHSGSQNGLGSKTHKDQTKEAILGAAEKVLRDNGYIRSSSFFTSLTAEKLVSAAYGSKASSKPFTSAISKIADANAKVDSNLPKVTAAHFDAENFAGGNARLLQYRSNTISEITKRNFDSARTHAGSLLHTLQDFYAHTNWIEMNNPSPYDRLGVPGRQPTGFASPSQPTCVNCQEATKIVGKSGRCPSTVRNLLVQDKLTSGFYSDQDRKKPASTSLSRVAGVSSANAGKCSHGGILDSTRTQTATGGINKDSTSASFSPHYDLHQQAAEVSVKATRAFLDDVRSNVGNCLFMGFLGLEASACTRSRFRRNASQTKRRTSIGHLSFSTRDTDELETKLGEMDDNSTPLQGLNGLIRALHGTEPGSTMFLFTNETAPDSHHFSEASSLIFKKMIRLFVMFTGRLPSERRRRRRDVMTHDNAFDLLAEQSGGQLLSGNENDVETLHSLTSNFVEPSDVTLHSRVTESPTDAVHGFNVTTLVDKTMTELVVSVSGLNPRINVLGPGGDPITFKRSDIAEFASSSAARVSNPSAGLYTIQTFSSSAYTFKVKGQSTFDFEHSLVTGDASAHFGTFSIKGRPRVGDRFFVEITVSGVEPTFDIKTAVMLSEDSTEIARLELTEVAEGRFLSTSSLLIPSENFRVAVQGKVNGETFQRVDPHLEMPVPFSVTILRDSSLSFVQGVVSDVRFRILNGESADTLRFELQDERKFAGSDGTFAEDFHLDVNRERTVVVPFAIPPCVTRGGEDKVTITLMSLTTKESTSFSIIPHVESESFDLTPPVCFLDKHVPCPATGRCSDNTWSATFSAIDTSSGLFSIVNISDVVSFTVTPFTVGSSARNTFVSFAAKVSCCVDQLDARVTDYVGNTGTCSIGSALVQLTSPAVCPCLNGGRCMLGKKCFCLAGFHGDRCEFADGCPSPLVPEHGLLSSSASGFGYRSSVTYSCREGFALVGQPQTTCCPFGWTGFTPECAKIEVKEDAPRGYVFGSGSYIRVISQIGFHKNTFSITFRPNSLDALLFYSGHRSDRQGDFIAVTMNGGYVNLRFTLGQGELHLRHNKRLEIGAVYTLTVSHKGRRGSLVVNGEASIGKASGVLRTLNYQRPARLYVGGVPSEISWLPGGVVRNSLSGCVMKVTVNGRDVDLSGNGVAKYNAVLGQCGSPLHE